MVKRCVWTVDSRRTDYTWKAEIWAYWELEGDPISDDFIPSEINAKDLFFVWRDSIKDRYENNLIPIYWFAKSKNPNGKFETMPLCFHSNVTNDYHKNFLTYYDIPYNENLDEIRWVDIPIVDKLWNKRHCDKGGFIQSATGWKPSILQPYVWLDMLTYAALTK